MAKRKPQLPPPVYVHVCTSCGEPFESPEPDRTRCYGCPPHRGWRSDPAAYDDADANRKSEPDR